VDAHDLLQRDGEKAVGVVVAHVLLEGERQTAQIVETFDLLRRHPGLAELLTIKRDRGVDPLQRLAQTLDLQRLDDFPGQGFKFIVPDH